MIRTSFEQNVNTILLKFYNHGVCCWDKTSSGEQVMQNQIISDFFSKEEIVVLKLKYFVFESFLNLQGRDFILYKERFCFHSI